MTMKSDAITFKGLQMEFNRNEREILRLTKRNKAIDAALTAVQKLVQGTRPKATENVTPKAKAGDRRVAARVNFPGVSKKVFEAVGQFKGAVHIKDIAKLLYEQNGRLPEGATDSVAKACALWVQKGQLVRVRVGVYALAMNGPSEPKAKRESAKIGHDTKVTQMTARDQ